MFDRRGSVAEETSFANAGVVAPAEVTPWAAPGMPAKVLRHLLSRHAPVRQATPLGAGQWAWLWRWWRACRAPVHAANRARLHRLARYSHQRLGQLSQTLNLAHEQSRGCLVLLRTARDLAGARGSRTGVKHNHPTLPRCEPWTSSAPAPTCADSGHGPCAALLRAIRPWAGVAQPVRLAAV